MTAWSDYAPSDQERAKAAYMKYLNMQDGDITEEEAVQLIKDFTGRG